MARNTKIEPLSDAELLVARLQGETIRIPTSSTNGAYFPMTMQFHLGDGYSGIEGQRPDRLEREYWDQFEQMNLIAKHLTGRGITHMWTAESGRNFIYIVGDLFNPTMVWRRTGTGQGANNTLLYKGVTHSVTSFIATNRQDLSIRPGMTVKISKEAALREVERAEKELFLYIISNRKSIKTKKYGDIVREGIAEYEAEVEFFKGVMRDRRNRFMVCAVSNQRDENKRQFLLRKKLGDEREVSFRVTLKEMTVVK